MEQERYKKIIILILLVFMIIISEYFRQTYNHLLYVKIIHAVIFVSCTFKIVSIIHNFKK